MEDRWGNTAEVDDLVIYAPNTGTSGGYLKYGRIVEVVVKDGKEKFKVELVVDKREETTYSKPKKYSYWEPNKYNFILAKSVKGVLEWLSEESSS